MTEDELKDFEMMWPYSCTPSAARATIKTLCDEIRRLSAENLALLQENKLLGDDE